MIIDVRIVAGVVFPSRASQPMKPPANESPAPVGSTTSSIGNAGAANTPPSWNSSAPASPRLMTTDPGPIARIARAAAGRFACPDSWRASSSLSSSMSTRSSSFTSSGRLMSIQRFIVSQATKRGFLACSSTSSCSTGSMLARNT